MVCLNLSNGFFIPQNWSTAPNFNAGDVTITRDATQITVQRAGLGGSLSAFGNFRYAVFGDLNFVALLRQNSLGGGTSTWIVSIVDITGTNIGSTPLFTVPTPGTRSPPIIASSQGNGRLAFLWSGTGTANQARNMMIVRSDNGSVVLPGPGTISNLNGNIAAEITATQLIIHHPNTGVNDDTAGPRPVGSLTAIPASQDFGEAVLGAADPSLATVTRTFTLRNTGSDCLTVNTIQNSPPYSIVPASVALLPRELDAGEEFEVQVRFAPSTTGNSLAGSLPITRTPANGASSLECIGDARNAEARISVSRSTIAFGTIPHPDTVSQSFAVTNTGEKDIFINIPSPSAGSSFQWTPVGTLNLPVGGTPVTVTVTFTTPGDFPAPGGTVTITPSEGSARSVSLSGAGCIANPVMGIPPAGPIDFGQIEQGFRTVRFIEVGNTGDGDLTFDARIKPSGDPVHAALFGLVLPDSDITNAIPTRTYSVLPPTRCGSGPTGTEPAFVAVSFFADSAANATYSAQLEIDNPTTGTATTFQLSARITPPVAIDALLVLDNSGSMADPIGTRNKMEAAIAGGQLLVQLLRENADDRAAIITYSDTPHNDQPMVSVAGNRSALLTALGSITPAGSTNIAGGIILGEDEFSDPVHPKNPPNLKKAMVVLTDGKENRCFQKDGTGPWFSITGRGVPHMWRPDGTPQNTDALPAPDGIKIYAIGIGNHNQIDEDALNDLSMATGAYFAEVVELSGKDFFLLEKYFTQIFMDAVGRAVISDPFYTIAVSETHEHEFDIFPGDVNAMAVIYDEHDKRLPFHLVTPNGEEISGTILPPGFGVRYQSTDTARVVEVTFPKLEPKRYAGRWKVVVDHRGYVCAGDINLPDQEPERDGEEEVDARALYAEVGNPGFVPQKCRGHEEPVDYGVAIGAGSNLRMQPYVEPGTKHIGDVLQLNASLAEAGLPVKAATVRVRVESPTGAQHTITLRDDGHSQDGDADDGDYGGQFTQTSAAGVYKLNFRAEGRQAGRPYVREAHRTKAIYGRRESPREQGESAMDNCCRKLLNALQALAEDRSG